MVYSFTCGDQKSWSLHSFHWLSCHWQQSQLLETLIEDWESGGASCLHLCLLIEPNLTKWFGSLLRYLNCLELISLLAEFAAKSWWRRCRTWPRKTCCRQLWVCLSHQYYVTRRFHKCLWHTYAGSFPAGRWLKPSCCSKAPCWSIVCWRGIDY